MERTSDKKKSTLEARRREIDRQQADLARKIRELETADDAALCREVQEVKKKVREREEEEIIRQSIIKPTDHRGLGPLSYSRSSIKSSGQRRSQKIMRRRLILLTVFFVFILLIILRLIQNVR
ncbi:MAG: hypothetical protein SFY92_01485 [Verrucomicrobiae bacterium]|nr:hypothetical protein [Verrucomicrobiae bacterium]